MFERVLVGIDEETHGRDAIALARQLASQGAEFTFAHVHPAVEAANAPLDERIEHAEHTGWLLGLVAGQSGLDARTRVEGAATVGAGLHSIAGEIHADLIVVGTTGRSRLTRVLLGNPTTEALTGAGCAVAVASEGYAERAAAFRTVGVAYDGSDASEAALELGQRLAELWGAELSAFEVVPPPVAGALLEPRPAAVRRASTALTAARVRIAAHEGVAAHAACGDPVQQLAGYSATVDLLVAGSRGAGPIARLLHPSTTAALTDVVQCPLLVLTKDRRP